MNSRNNRVTKTNVESTARKAANNPIMEALTRLGYGVRGLIYITMGILALNVALGKSNAPVDQQGAIAAIGRQPAGLVLLWVILFGLVSYSLWGLVRAVLDPLHKGSEMKGLFARAGYLVSAIGYAYLIFPTYGFISGAKSTAQNGAQSQQSLATIMSKPWGPWVIGLLGLVVLAVGVYQMYQGLNASFDKQFQTYAMTAREVRLATQIGRFGTAARGFVFALVGFLICQAALNSNSGQPVGVDAALSTILRQPFGVWLLAIVAVGLMAFGVYSLLSAAWFRLRRNN